MAFDALLAEPRLFTIVGLSFDMLGVLLIAFGVVSSRRELIEQHKISGTSFFGEPTDETVQKSPAFRDRIRQARTAWAGAALLFFGFLLQAVGAWLR